MYKYFSVFSLGFLFYFASCSPNVEQENRITVTIEPQRYFVEQLADTLFEVITMVLPGSSPETYDPSPVQLTELAKSKAYFAIGELGFEKAWLKNLKKNNSRVRFFETNNGIDFIVSEECSHSHHAHSDHDHHHSHEGVDPHIWTSPKEVSNIVLNMYHALIELDANNSSIYKENLDALLEEIRQTDETVKALLAQSKQKAFIIYHPTLTYFAREYGLTQYSIEMDGKEPTPDQIKKIIDTAKQNNVQTVFIQQEFDTQNAELIAKETNCRLVVINPLAYNWSEEMINIAKALSDETIN